MECKNLKSPELRFPLQLQKRADFTLRLTFLHRSGVARGEENSFISERLAFVGEINQTLW